MQKWYIYKGDKKKRNLKPDDLPPEPPWREFDGEVVEDRELETDERTIRRGETFEAGDKEIEMVNAALYLRRPLLVTGKPGTGKSSLACSVAWELGLGSVLYWPITTRTTLKDGLYEYDALGRLQELQIDKIRRESSDGRETCDAGELALEKIGRYIRLGPLGTALLPSEVPRVLLIDEIDKSDIDLPNDLLHIFEEGEFEIPELSRLANIKEDIQAFPCDSDSPVAIRGGKVKCKAFPFVVLTSNAERELPAPFLRRCLRLDIPEPNAEKLARIVRAHFDGIEGKTDENSRKIREDLIHKFLERRKEGELATDQLLNAIYLTTRNIDIESGATDDKESLIKAVFRYLDRREAI